jgi:hypothetical protein
MKLSFKHLTAAGAAVLLGAATLNAQTGTPGTSSAGAPATDQQSPDRTPTTSASAPSPAGATTTNGDNNNPGSSATDTSTNAAPSTSAATTTNTASKASHAMSARTIYLGTGYKGTPASLAIKHGYKVYDENGKLVGHLTDTSGSTIKALPASGDFQIKTRAGKLIGSTQAGDGVDSSRAVQLTP